ncbi:putative virus X resistance protein-like, coiled-coil [Helianthus annuus]|uniref:Putative NB-ARC n=2 Tax=Helianthus annuus TaxID=4232 RepID=A0A251SWN8_HELAN|nr:probable disease resistance protein RF45 [Helianthus annuus]XP_022002294.1 probable disease resistance protein RF45 [Helianthus annuus]XP_022002295.1 probable disease resistance protein RF45 [Helianthus annuus]KAF5794378.1 putative virus X resistance protein-like, coiled-coil [Helianthus annuus]KAF5794381.1 putative virus X resistance protein-like, coiled-coil [Helianthus annuus]KAF5794382.1 putative virus X resistance protein-like, coiled-coil [Helianthus annuus]KAJ0552654.1 putative viru
MAVEAIVSVVLHNLTNLRIEESNIFKKVRDEVERVVMELREMQSILNEVEHQEQGDKVLTEWILKFLDIVYRVKDDIESFSLTETRLKNMGLVKKRISVTANKFKLCREVPDEMVDSMNVRRLKSKMNGISKEIQEWKEGKPSLALAPVQGSYAMNRDEQPWQESDGYYAPKKEETIFKKDVEKLVKQLTSNSKPLQIILVFGEVGTGKTAHVKTIYNKLEVKNKFPCHAFVILTTKCSIRYLMITILQQVTSLKAKDKLKDEDLMVKLNEFLKGQKYLIVVIDVKSSGLLKQLKDVLPDTNNGSRVVITTPDEEVASFPDATTHYHFKPLDMEDGLKFFIKKVWGVKGIPFAGDVIEDLKNKIAERCKGTPLRIIMLAGLLSTRKMMYEDWLSVFEQHDFAAKSPSFDILAFCYNDLTPHVKLCFLYLGLFRKGFEIPVRRLFRLWLAEGYVKPSEGVILEDIVEGYLEELVKRNMVEITKRRSDGTPKRCRMIGVLYDIFMPKGVEIGLFHLHQTSDENPNATTEPRFGVRRVVEYTNIKDYPSTKPFNQNLRSYISFNGRKKDTPAEEVGTFLERIIGVRGFGLLRVLDLEGVYRPQLPENLGSLYHLRYLGLRWTFLDTLPSSLGDLLYLETLDIKHTHITALPSSIWNMKHLRHLCLNGVRLDIPVQSTRHRAPSQLQTLWGLFVDEKIARKIGLTLSRMTNLRKLDLTRQSSSTVKTTTITTATTTTTTTTCHSSSYEEIGLWISSLSSLPSLRLRSKDKMGRPSELIVKPFSSLVNLSQLYLLGSLHKSIDWYQMPPALKVLTLSVSHLEKDPMPTLSQLPSLIVLRLLAASYVGEEMCCPENGFPALQVLKLWKLERLKIWTAHGGTMPNLHTLDIRCCRELEEIPVTLLQIQSFENLILTNMPKQFVSGTRKKKKKHTKIVENE